MKYAPNIAQLARLPIHYMGFIFHPKSPRYVVDTVGADLVPAGIKKVGVFVDASAEYVCDTVRKFGLQAVQLHGQESPDTCKAYREALSVEVLKAFSVEGAESLARTADYQEACDLFVFDTKTPLHGGSGKQFDWTVLRNYKGSRPFLLSGGIGPADVAAVKAFCHPAFLGVDLNSRFETQPGLKDIEALRQFIVELNN